jgi:hypothetical protein
MSMEALEQRVKEMEAQLKAQSPKPTKFTDKLKIPEDATPEQIQKILSDFEDHLTEQMQEIPKKVEQTAAQEKEAAKKAKFDSAVAAFKAKHPVLFEEKNQDYLEMMEKFLHKSMAAGKEPAEALEESFKSLTEKTTFREAPEKKKEEAADEGEDDDGEILSSGNFNLSSKVSEKDIEKKGIKNERDAVASATAALKAEGLKFPE